MCLWISPKTAHCVFVIVDPTFSLRDVNCTFLWLVGPLLCLSVFEYVAGILKKKINQVLKIVGLGIFSESG